MQLQMEVCNLDECDFLETKFTEYDSYEAFENDSEYSIEYNPSLKLKGIIIFFYNNLDNKPVYIYKPIEITNDSDISDWQQNSISIYEAPPYNYTFIRYICWKLEIFHCILVLRNKDWFKNNIHQLANVWKTIEEERITGYEHRASSSSKKNTVNKYFENVIKLEN